MRTKKNRKTAWTLYYDGNCGVCQGIKKWLMRLDVFNTVAWVPYQTLDEPLPGLTWEDFDCSVYLDTGSGQSYYPGFFAFRMMTLKLLLLMPLAPVFWFPGFSLLGTRFYRWFAQNRYRFSKCDLPVVNEESDQV